MTFTSRSLLAATMGGLVLCFLAGQHAQAQTASGEFHVQIRAPVQIVKTDDTRFRFAARVRVCSNTDATGFVAFQFARSGAPLTYQAVFGTVQFNRETGPMVIIWLVLLDDDGNLLDEAIATVRPDPAVPGCDIWSFMSNGVHDAHFDAMGTIRLRPGC